MLHVESRHLSQKVQFDGYLMILSLNSRVVQRQKADLMVFLLAPGVDRTIDIAAARLRLDAVIERSDAERAAGQCHDETGMVIPLILA